VVKALAALGAAVSVPDTNGWTPGCIAVQQGRVEVVNMLASFGADVTVPNKNGATPVYVAAQNGHL
jgi:ankyrin repeat protein